jgi:hypothetical protein
MPIEIRELVIQAKVNENPKENPEGTQEGSAVGGVGIEEVRSLIEEEVNNSFSIMKKAIIKEMKIWMVEYLKKENQQF